MNAMLRLAAWLIAVALVALPVVAVLRGWIGADRWPLTHLRATGRFERVDPSLVQRALLPYAKHGYFAVDLKAAQAAVAQLPWVDRAQVRKRWPDVLEVSITEHRPFARWGQGRLLSDKGRLFDARGAKVPAGLPQFDGPETQAADVVELYQQSRTLFAPVGMNVQAVAVDPRGSWSLTLFDRAHGGFATQVIVGRSEARARIGRFVRLLPQLMVNPERHIERADLRYTNGFALTWAGAVDAAKRALAAPPTPRAPPTAALFFPRIANPTIT
ncbi:cell division protein FtsQ/DivIB [Cognatilysobacter lacus]|uniref:Cell division protein FtsQ n=1 Tax=Cognatilysobacter lacus TaxID=1643323 RepID=A0A5D8Z3D7_9GAMM|nr:cell division protein FtsQ/DivIB [Lysobacter lacus]TZF89505.1 cell division protein FtsQ/DivIB [Lysobacter lacus]